MFYGDHTVVDDHAGKVPIGETSGQPVAEAFRTNKAVIHKSHGLLTASRHSIDDAAWLFIAFNRACQVQLLIESSGATPVPVSDEDARETHKHLGSSFVGFLSFQPYYAEIEAELPDTFR